jgi:hypothetical protein
VDPKFEALRNWDNCSKRGSDGSSPCVHLGIDMLSPYLPLISPLLLTKRFRQCPEGGEGGGRLKIETRCSERRFGWQVPVFSESQVWGPHHPVAAFLPYSTQAGLVQ